MLNIAIRLQGGTIFGNAAAIGENLGNSTGDTPSDETDTGDVIVVPTVPGDDPIPGMDDLYIATVQIKIGTVPHVGKKIKPYIYKKDGANKKKIVAGQELILTAEMAGTTQTISFEVPALLEAGQTYYFAFQTDGGVIIALDPDLDTVVYTGVYVDAADNILTGPGNPYEGVPVVHGQGNKHQPSFDTLTIGGTPVTSGLTGDDYSFQLTAAGGIAPYTFSVHTGTLPPDVEVDEDFGLVAGELTTPGSYTGIVLRVTDSATPPNTADLGSFNVTVSDPVPNIFDILSTPATNLVTNTNGAARMRFTKAITGANGGVLQSLWCQPFSMAAGAKARMFIYSDNAGVPGTKLGTSDEVTFSAISTFTMVEFPFSVQPTLAAATPYWIAIQQDTSMVAALCATSPGGYLLDGFAYGSAPASAAGAISSLAFSFWGRIAWVGTPATLSAPLVSVAAGVVNNNFGNYGTIQGPYAIDDYLVLQFTYTTVGTTVPTFITPPGAASIDSSIIGTLAYFKTQLYELRIAAGQNPRIPLEMSTGQGQPSIAISLFRGITTGAAYEAINKAAANSGNAVTANTTTLGNNRTLCTFFAFDVNYTGSSPSGSWAQQYETAIGSRHTVMLDTLDAPTTGAYTADTRNPNFNRWAAISLALIKA